MTPKRFAALAIAGLISTMMMADEGRAQGLPLYDSPGTTGNSGYTTNGSSYDNTGGGWYNSGYTYYQPQPVLAWSTTAYLEDADAIVISLRNQGYTVTFRNRVISYNYYGPVYVTDIYAYVYR